MGNAIIPGPVERLKPSYRREWLVVLAMLALASGAYYKVVYRSPVPGASFPLENKKRFLVLRLPEMPSNPVVASAGKKRLEQWLTSLLSAGYNPVPFSRALSAISGAAGLPPRAIVFVYDPGDRPTYDVLSSIFARHHVPAAWITPGAAVEQHDVRFLSKHRLNIMKHSGLWDVGYVGDSTMTFTLGGKSYAWGADVGRFVLNGTENLGALNRLNVNLTWTGPQLLSILRAMAPTQESCLATGVLLGKRVGIVKPAADCGPADAFALEAPLDAHSASMAWRGASSIQDFSLIVEADSIVDELMLYLRYDSRQRRGIVVMFSPRAVGVMDVKAGKKKSIATRDWAYAGGPFVSSLSLSGRRLNIGVGNGPMQSIQLPEADGTPGKNIVLMAYSKLRGAAQARSVRLILTPL